MKWLNESRLGITCACVMTAALASAVAAGAASDTAKNLLVNGNAEQGEAKDGYDVVAEIPGWVRKGKFTVVRYGAPNGFPDAGLGAKLGGGANFFAGGPENPNSAISQDVNVAPNKALIDTGKAKATLSGYIGGYAGQDDSLIATALFLSAAGKKLGTIRIGPVGAAARKAITGMQKQKAIGPVPARTRVIRVVLAATRSGGAYNDGYADNLSLTITR